jgi:hypothetical protein
MPLSDSQRAYVRSEIGSAEPPSDSDLDDRFDALGHVSGLILEVLRGRRADLIAAGGVSTGFTVSGFYSESSSSFDTLRALDDQIRWIMDHSCDIDEGDYLGTLGVSSVRRVGYDRRSRVTYPTGLA